MARTRQFSEAMVESAKQHVKEAHTATEIRVGLAVLIPALCGTTNEQTAELLSVGSATVIRLQRGIRDQVSGVEPTGGKWGGRRRESMSLAQERAFLAPWDQCAERGEVVVVPPIQAALEEQLGRPVAPSTAYRLLARHGWRKVAPDTCHPKRDPDAQEAFKKGALPRHWRKLGKPIPTDSP